MTFARMVLVPAGLTTGENDIANVQLSIRARFAFTATFAATVVIKGLANLFTPEVLRKRRLAGIALALVLLCTRSASQVILNHGPA